jgi:hypothetical protein
MERKTQDIRAAQRQALDLLQQQRAALHTQERIRSRMRLQRKRWAELVVLTGADHLDDAQLVAALLRAAEDGRDPVLREKAQLIGEAYLQRRPLPPHLT